MAQLTLSKSQLTREKDSLASYRRYLPALDLKRQQLMGERNKAREKVKRLEDDLAQAIEVAGAALPMLADRRITLDGLARFKSARFGQQNVAGVRLPTVEAVEVDVTAYGLMTRPHWVDVLVVQLEGAIRLKVEAEVARRRVELLDRAVTRVTQRTNLFEKILIPQTQKNIRRIMIYLDDAARAGVVAAKLSKRKREAESVR